MSGVELATEWVTILPETAQLVKELKNFKPPPIDVEIRIKKDKAGNASAVVDKKAITKEAEKAGESAGEAIVTGVKKEMKDLPKEVGTSAKKTGETFKREMVKPIAKVSDDIEKAVAPKANGRIRQAAERIGQTIREAISRDSEKAGQESGNKLAKGLERAKGAVTKAERSLADARLAASNIESRIRQQEQRIQQYREASARGLRQIAAEEKIYSQMRANQADHTADQIAAQERKIQTMQAAQQNRMVRLSAAEESHGRLMNSQEAATNRTANQVDNLGAKQAALAAAVAASNDPLDDNNRKMKQGGLVAGGMMASLIPLGRQMLVTSGLFTGALGVGGLATDVVRTGVRFQDSMNTIQGITQASGEEMAALSEKSRELGRDMMLPMATATGASQAMLELVRAGFSVQQAMDASRGSLQLAAAANLEEAEAAQIVGTTLNAFALDATEAGKVTDVLANAANEFPGEMKDFGYSLSQSGAVAKSFGVDLEDTTTALGLLARAGIKSSDAGTLIKTMLLSLTDTGKPAQEAIRELGLELYDQEGKFKGLEYVYKRLTEASKEMTQEQYQAATQTLFGTDAARFAGLAAGASAEEWDKFRKAMERTGSAADVSNARMEGMPGAIERVKNSWQDLALTIFDAIQGPLTSILNKIAEVLLGFSEWLRGPLVQWLSDHKEELIGVGAVLGTYVTILGAVKIATMAWAAATWLVTKAFQASPVGWVVTAIAALVAGVIYAYKNFEDFREVVDDIGRALKQAWIDNWPAIKQVLSAIGEAIQVVWRNVLVPFGRWLRDTFFPKYFGYVKFMWQNVWKPALSGIATALGWLWNNVLKPFGTWLITNWPTAWEGAKRIWAVIQPILKFIGAGFKVLWAEIKIAWAVGKAVFDAIGSTVKFLWGNIIKPAWNAITQGSQFLGQVLGVVFQEIRKGIDFWAEGVKWLWHTILEPAWEAIKAGFNTVKEFLSPIWDAIKGGLEGVGTVASKIAEGIKTAWSGIAEVFKVPLHALGTFLANIPGAVLGVEIPGIDTIHDWGKKLQGLRTGGVIRGPGTGTSDSILGTINGVPSVRVSNGEGIVPERVMTTPIGRVVFDALVSRKLPGLKAGGSIGRNSGNSSKSGLSPGASYLDDVIRKMFGVTDIGGLRSEDGYGEHSSGNALDIMIGSDTALGNQIAGFLKTNKDTLGIDGMIWNNRSYGYGGGWEGRGYTGPNPHTDHVHVILGKGRGASAADAPLPSGPLVDPSTGRNITGGSTMAGTSSLYSSSSGGYVVDPKKVRNAEDRVEDRTNQLETAQLRLDEQLAKQAAGETVKESTIVNARNQVEKFQRELDQAKSDLEEAKRGEYKEGKGSGKGSEGGSDDWSSVGGMIFNGFLESMGFDGSVFKNLFEAPNVKSAIAAANWGLGMLFPGEGENAAAGAPQDLGLGGGDGSGILGVGTEMLAGVGEQAGLNFPTAHGDMAMAGGTPGPGNTFDLRGSQLGVSPGAFEDKMGEMTAASKRHPTLGPG